MNSQVKISLKYKKGKTIIDKGFWSAPQKIFDLPYSDKVLKVMQCSSAPGILSNDQYKTDIRLQKEACLSWETQSFQRIFKMKEKAKIATHISLSEKSSLLFCPHPTVLHENSKLECKNTLSLKKDSRLIWCDSYSLGRKDFDPPVSFDFFHSKSQIKMEQRLIFSENIFLYPKQMNITGDLILRNYSHFGSLVLAGNNLELESIQNQIREVFEGYKNSELTFGCTELAYNSGLLVKVFGSKGEQMFEFLKKLSSFLFDKIN